MEDADDVIEQEGLEWESAEDEQDGAAVDVEMLEADKSTTGQQSRKFVR